MIQEEGRTNCKVFISVLQISHSLGITVLAEQGHGHYLILLEIHNEQLIVDNRSYP